MGLWLLTDHLGHLEASWVSCCPVGVEAVWLLRVEQVVVEWMLVLGHHLLVEARDRFVVHKHWRLIHLAQSLIENHEWRNLHLRTAPVLLNLVWNQKRVELQLHLGLEAHVLLVKHWSLIDLPHLRMVPPLSLLDLSLVVIIMLFQVNYYKSNIVFAVIVSAALKSYLLRDLLQTVPRITHFRNHLCDFNFTENHEEAISRKDQKIVILLDVVGGNLWLWNQELLVLEVTNSSTNS